MTPFSKKMAGLLLLSIFTPLALAQIRSWDLKGTTLDQKPDLAGTIVEDTIRTWSWIHSPERYTVNGTIQDRVVRRKSSGNLDFYTRIMMDPQSSSNIFALRKEGFKLPGTYEDANYRIDGLGERAPVSITHDVTTGLYEFSWHGIGIMRKESSKFVYIGTTAKTYDKSGTTSLFAYDSPAIRILNTYRPVS